MSDNLRLDKWLWAARFFKTRSLATDAIERGRVKVNEERVKPARNVRIGDLLDIDNGSSEWQVRVEDLSDKRGRAGRAAAVCRNRVQRAAAAAGSRAPPAVCRAG